MNKLKKFIGVSVAAILLSAGLYSCGGGGGGESTSQTTSTTPKVAGVVYDGPVSGATVKVYPIYDNGSVNFDVLCGEGTTDDNGSYSITMKDSCKGAIYIEADNGTNNNFGKLESMLDNITENATAAVTPLTTVASKYVKQVGTTPENIKQANQTIAQMFLGDNVSITAVLPTAPNSKDNNTTAKIYGAISEAMDNVSIDQVVNDVKTGQLSSKVAQQLMEKIKKNVNDNITLANNITNTLEKAVQNGVTPPTVKGKLTIHTGYEGIYVSIDNKTTLKPIETKQTNENGDATFNNLTGPFVTTTIAFTPDIVVSKDLLLWRAILAAAYDNKKLYNHNAFYCNAIEQFDNRTIRKADLESIIGYNNQYLYLDNSTITKDDIENYTANENLTENQLYDLLLQYLDKNGDEKLELNEITKFVNTEVAINTKTPLGEYDAFTHYEHYGRIYDVPKKIIRFNLIDIPARTWYYDMKLPTPRNDFGFDAYQLQHAVFNNTTNETDNLTICVPIYFLDNGKFTAIIQYWDNHINTKDAYILDNSSDNITVNISEKLKPTKEIAVNNLSLPTNLAINFYGLTKNASYQVGVSRFNYNKTTINVADIPFESFSVHYFTTDNVGEHDTFQKGNDIVIDSSIPDSIDVDNLIFPNINILANSDGSLQVCDNISAKKIYGYSIYKILGIEDNSTKALKYYYRFSVSIEGFGRDVKEAIGFSKILQDGNEKFTPPFKHDNVSSILPDNVSKYIEKVNEEYSNPSVNLDAYKMDKYEGYNLDTSYHNKVTSAQEWLQKKESYYDHEWATYEHQIHTTTSSP